jgi:hypothetical protein
VRKLLASWRRQLAGAHALILLAVTFAMCAGAEPASGAAAAYPLPVKTVSKLNQAMPDPGVYLYGGNFHAFSTGKGLLESRSHTSGGRWSTPVNLTSATFWT